MNAIADAVARENRPHMPDPAEQQAYAEQHGDRSKVGWKELSDVQIASRVRMLMRDDWTHEAVCTATRDRICCLVLEKQALVEALEEARAALHHHYVDWDGEPEDAVPLQLARAKCDAALARGKGGLAWPE